MPDYVTNLLSRTLSPVDMTDRKRAREGGSDTGGISKKLKR